MKIASFLNVSARWSWIMAALWTLVIGISLAWNLKEEHQEILRFGEFEARALLEQVLVTRQWNAEHDGVYVEVNASTRPNPHLAGLVAERDITTPLGKQLTLINPTYMIRQINDIISREKDHRLHATSLKPIRPENAPDIWETGALRAFEQGDRERLEVVEMDGKPYMRLMQPLTINKSCIQCHTGYKQGDIRGGLSASVAMAKHVAFTQPHIDALILTHGLLWLLGIGIIRTGVRQVSGRMREQAAFAHTLQVREERIALLLESTAEAIYGLDRDGLCTFVNPACLRLLGYEQIDDLLGKSMHALSHHSRPDGSPYPEQACPIYDAVRFGEQVHADDEWLWRRDGSGFAAEFWAHPIIRHGEINGAVVSFFDISERKQAEEQLETRLDELERFRKVAIDRELRIKALRDENAALQQRNGESHGNA